MVNRKASMALDKATDTELMLRFSRWRDESAFEHLVRRWEGPVFSYLAKAAGNWHAAGDLRQEVFIRVYRYGRTYNPDYKFTTWLFRIASNVLSTWRKKRRRGGVLDWFRRNEDEASDIADASPGPREFAARVEAREKIDDAVAKLDDADRELLLLRLDLELSYREIGKILDMPETTVKSRFYKLLERLRKALESAGIDPGTVRV